MQIQELGHVVLYVSDLERSRRFYRDLLGFRELHAIDQVMAVYSSGRTHHELLLIQVGRDATPIPHGPRVGMYHFGLKIGESDDDLRNAVTALRAAGVKIVGASDHTVTHSLYIEDPDGNEIELYIDVQPAVWRDDPTAVVSPIKPLRL
jgi:catechol-2,3-dioxygenase